MNEKQALIDLIIHDLTGPLSVVSTSVENLLAKETRYGSLTKRQKEALERVLRNSKKAQRLLQEMIEVYRSEEGLFRKEYFLIEDVVKEGLLDAIEVLDPEEGDRLAKALSKEEFFRMLNEYGVFIDIKGIYKNELFHHDPKKVGQILRNLFSNALKYRQSRVAVIISGDKNLAVSVENDGSGIPVEKQSYIFKRFFQLRDKPDIDIQKGLGFGLSCVKSLVETMNGEITLLSGEGKGTCFTVHIPPLEFNNP